MDLFNTLLMSQGGDDPTASFIMMGAILVIFYFFMIRPQQKKQKEAKAFRENLAKGSQIVTIGGIHGKVEEVKDTTVIIATAGGGKMKIEKSAISSTSTASELDIAQNSK
jgi:preprotein translocase subunit YajC